MPWGKSRPRKGQGRAPTDQCSLLGPQEQPGGLRSTGALRHAGACLSYSHADHMQNLFFTICDTLGKLLKLSGPVLGLLSKG